MNRKRHLSVVVCLLVLSLCIPLVSAGQQEKQSGSTNVGVVAVLADVAAAGTTVLRVNDTRQVERHARLLLKSRDGSKHELHYIGRVRGHFVYLDDALSSSYSPWDLLIQGCECDRALGLPEDGLIGTLNEEVPAKSSVLKYTPIVPLDPRAKLLIRRKDGSEEEVHPVKTHDATDTITVAGKLKHAYQPGDMLIQGCHVPISAGGGLSLTKLLLGAGAGAAATGVVTIISDCDDCCP